MTNRQEILNEIDEISKKLESARNDILKGLKFVKVGNILSMICASTLLIYICQMLYLSVDDQLLAICTGICLFVISFCYILSCNILKKRSLHAEKHLRHLAALRDWSSTRDDEIYHLPDEVSRKVSLYYITNDKLHQERILAMVIWILSNIEIILALIIWIIKMNEEVI